MPQHRKLYLARVANTRKEFLGLVLQHYSPGLKHLVLLI